MGVQVVEVRDTLTVALSQPLDIPAPVHAYRSEGGRGRRPVGLYRSYTASMDEGWTRWVFDTWGVPYESVVDSTIRKGGLERRYDVMVIPSQSPRDIVDGLPSGYPAPYAGGLGPQGTDAVRAFVRQGGTLVTLNEASRWAIEALSLPVEDVQAALDERRFYAPGSIFRLELDSTHALSRGMSRETVAWYEGGPLFRVRDTTVTRVVGRYAPEPGDVLLSGWVLGPDHAAGMGALVEARVERGRVVLFGFRPQYRGQTLATYPLLFNALQPIH
jgi:hypothetical protein